MIQNASPRILFLVNVDRFFLSHRLPIARAAREKGAEVWVAASPTGQEGKITGEGFHFVPVPFQRGVGNLGQEVRTLRAILRAFQEIKPDLVHNVTAKPVLYSSLVSRFFFRELAVVNAISGLGYVFISSRIGTRLLRSGLLLPYRAALRRERARVIFQNPDDMESFIELNLVRRSSAVLIKGSGVDIEVFRESHEPNGIPLVMLASRLLTDKGVLEFVAAARLLRNWNVKCRLVLVGEPDPGNPATLSPAQLSSWVDEGVVDWWGPQSNMQEVLPLASIVVLPSYREGLPKVLLEAAAVGRPIVTTNVPGCREVVRDGHNGFIVPPRNHVRLAQAIRCLVENPQLRLRMGKNGRTMVVDEFRAELVVSSTLAIYNELLGSRFPGLFAPPQSNNPDIQNN